MFNSRWIVLTFLGVLVVAVSISSAPSADAEGEGEALSGDISRGGKTYNLICVACHGDRAQGNLTFNAPKLVGQESWYITRQLKNFATGARGSDPRDVFGAQMRPMAMTLQGDQAIADVVAYIKSLEGASQ